MEYYQLYELVNLPNTLIPYLIKNFKPLFKYEAFKDYDVFNHDVFNHKKRPRRYKKVAEGRPINGVPQLVDVEVPVNRVGIPFQKLIVDTAVAFLTGGEIELVATPVGDIEQRMFDWIKQTWDDNKLDFENTTIAETMMSQLECAELWFRDVDDDGNQVMKMNIIAPATGYVLQPIFDGIGNLIGLAMGYKKNDVEGKKVDYYDLYTIGDDGFAELRKYIKDGTGWVYIQYIADQVEGLPPEKANAIIKLPYKKLPLMYYCQATSEWYDVQSMIERKETIRSNHGDTNDYSGSPVLFGRGKIRSAPDKGDPGKFLSTDDVNGDLKYVTPDGAPDSLKLEDEELNELIFLCSQTPNLSINNLKGLGSVPSGAAFERLLIAAYMKAKKKQRGNFGKTIQRRINFLKSAAAVLFPELKPAVKMNIKVKYSLFNIDDIADRIQNALNANGQKPIMSQEESIEFAGISDDPKTTFEKVKAEADALGVVIGGGI